MLKRLAKLMERGVLRLLNPPNAKGGQGRDPANDFLRNCKMIIHIGANEGHERDLYAHYSLSVIWVEALPDVYQKLVSNLAGYPTQKAFNALLTDSEGDVYDFHISDNSGESSSIYDLDLHREIWPGVSFIGSVQMRSTTLATLLREHKLENVAFDALILDVQGAELLVLEGAGDLLNSVRYVKAEAADFSAYKDACTVASLTQALKEWGFTSRATDCFAQKDGVGSYYNILYERDLAHATMNSQMGDKCSLVVNRLAMRCCASTGVSFYDKIQLGLYGLLAPMVNTDPSCRHRKHSWILPKVWLRPRQLGNLKLLIDPSDWSQTVIFDEVFLRGAYDLRKVTFDPSLIIDCGAHIGLFSLLAKGRFPIAAHMAFEPNPLNARLFRKAIRRNKVDIVLHEKAVSTEVMRVEFVAINSHGGRLASGDFDGISCEGAPTYSVETVDLCRVIENASPDSLLLKMDIEGEERRVLPAIIPVLPQRAALFFETHQGESGWRNIEHLLSSNGFQVERLNCRGVYSDGFAIR